MHRLSTTKPFHCVTCEVEITGRPTFHTGLPFCCAGCVAGGPCLCSYDVEPDDDARIRHCRDIAPLLRSDARSAFPAARVGKAG